MFGEVGVEDKEKPNDVDMMAGMKHDVVRDQPSRSSLIETQLM
jgi:hypothetical protein